MSKKSEKNEKFKSKIGGQALIEGVMMRGIDTSAMACRMPDGSIDVETWKIRNGKTAPWYLKTPFIRGCFNFAISLIDGMKCTMKSAEKQADADDDDDDDEPSKFEQWLSKTRPYKWLESKIEGENGKEVMNTIMLVVCVVVMILCVCAFKFFPALLSLPLGLLGAPDWCKTVFEGIIKVALLVGYMWLISHMKEIHKTFKYHGAEHKTIACYEVGDELTVENVRKYTRFHPRCGTSFLILVVIVSVFLYSVLPWSSTSLRVVFKLLLLPVVMGISYELLKWCGRSDNLATRIIRQPGLWVQRLTVFEPDDSMIEVAIAAVTPVLPEKPEDGTW